MKSNYHVAIYANGEEAELDLIEKEINVLVDFCLSKGYTNYTIYKDIQLGGEHIKEKCLQVKEDAKNGKVDLVLVYSLERCGRYRISTLYNSMMDLIQWGVDFKCFESPYFDTTSDFRKVLLHFLTVTIGYELKVTTKGIIGGMKKAKESGRTLGRPKKLDVDETLQAEILQMRNRGMSIRVVAEKLSISKSTVSNYLEAAKEVVLLEEAS